MLWFAINVKEGPQPKIEIDFKELDALLQFKVSCDFVADYLGTSTDTVQRRIKEKFNMTYTDYHKLKMERTAVKLQQKAIEQALTGNNNSVMIFALKNLAKWTDKKEVNIGGQDNEKTITLAYTLAEEIAE